jgi:hypothetical protein
VYDFFHAGGAVFVAMELVVGSTLTRVSPFLPGIWPGMAC